MNMQRFFFLLFILFAFSPIAQGGEFKKITGTVVLKNSQKFEGYFFLNTSILKLVGIRLKAKQEGKFSIQLYVHGGRMAIGLDEIDSVIRKPGTGKGSGTGTKEPPQPVKKSDILFDKLGGRSLRPGRYEIEMIREAPAYNPQKIPSSNVRYVIEKFETGDHDFSRIEKEVQLVQVGNAKVNGKMQPVMKSQEVGQSLLMVSTNSRFELQGFTYTLQKGMDWRKKVTADVLEAQVLVMAKALEQNLMKGAISEKIKKAFASKKIDLSPKAALMKDGKDKWKILDGERLFKIRKDKVKNESTTLIEDVLVVTETQLKMVTDTVKRIREEKRKEGEPHGPVEYTYRTETRQNTMSVPWRNYYFIKDLVVFKFMIENKMTLSALERYIVFDAREMNFARVYLSLDPRSFLTSVPKIEDPKKLYEEVMMRKLLKKYYRIEAKVYYLGRRGENIESWWCKKEDLDSPTKTLIWIQDSQGNRTFQSKDFLEHGDKPQDKVSK